MTCIAKLNFESAYVHIIHPDVWRNCDCSLCFHHRWGWTNAAHHSSTHHRPYKLKQPTNQPTNQATNQPTNQPTNLLRNVCFFAQQVVFNLGNFLFVCAKQPPDLPKWKYTQPHIATNSWHTFQTFPNHLGSKSSNGKNWQTKKTFKQQETSNFIKLVYIYICWWLTRLLIACWWKKFG